MGCNGNKCSIQGNARPTHLESIESLAYQLLYMRLGDPTNVSGASIRAA